MIVPKQAQSTAAVAAHYDELDSFYREIWGEHVHHGYWATGRETPGEAAEALVGHLARQLRLEAGQSVCDIGCGYGATAQLLAEQHGVSVTAVTVSPAQARIAGARVVSRGSLSVRLMDWLGNGFAAESFDRVYSVESSEHMPDKQLFFDEAFRTLKPGGLLGICAWLACDRPRAWEVRHLLEPICREGRLPGMGDEADYRRFADTAGFRVIGVEDLSDQVRRTWSICVRRVLSKLFTDPRYLRFLLDGTATDRIFALTMLRIMIAYRTRSMRYCLLVFQRDGA
nr:class I SAM-dependent methyltransferase [uncultured Rhodopila sp.]